MLIKKDEAKIVDKGSKIIRKYTSEDKQLEINHMILNGRTPENQEEFLSETEIHSMILVVKGKGKIFCGDDAFEVSEGDCIDVPKGTKFAAEGYDFEYIAAENPAWYSEQAKVVDKDGKIL